MTYRLKVYRPKDNERYDFLVDQLTKKLGKTPDEIKHLLDVGIRFKYSTRESLKKALEVVSTFKPLWPNLRSND